VLILNLLNISVPDAGVDFKYFDHERT
jgi:hypothetical protein